MSLRRSAVLVLVAALGLTPALVAVESAVAAYPAPFVGSSYNSTSYLDAQLGAMQVGVYYSDSVERAAGFDEWANSGYLPDGLAMTPSGDVLVISGTPTTPGDVSFRLDSTADGDNWDGLQFSVTVVGAPATIVQAGIQVLDSSTGTPATIVMPGGTAIVPITLTNGGSETLLAPRMVITLPAGVTSAGPVGSSPWACTGTQTITCTSSASLAPVSSQIVANLYIDIDGAFARSSFIITAQASGTNAPAVVASKRVMVSLPLTVLAPPADSSFNNVTLTAYAPYAVTNGYIQFQLSTSASIHYYGFIAVGSDGSASFSGPVDPAFNGFVDVKATWIASNFATWVDSAVGSIYVYNQLSAAGSFYLNGQLYTDAVKLYAYSDAGSSGAFLQYPGLTGGSYNITPPFGTRHNYYMWAELTDLGAPNSFYNSAGIATTDVADHTTVGPRNFSNSMNFYWELPASFTDATMAVPRQNVVFTDGVTAESNVTVNYAVTSGVLPTGLLLNPLTGAITGTAVTLGESYDFVITASNGYVDAVTDHITGTVLPEHIVPAWTDSTLGAFRIGQTVTDAVAAAGDPTISYLVTTGALPTGVTINPQTGAFGGAPTVLGEHYSFEINAHSSWGDVYVTFDGDVLPALAAPVWLDDDLGELRVGETFTDGVSASGVPAPTYTVTGLPAWATLNASTGAISATPTSVVAYDFTITAQNSEGDVDVHFVGVVEPAWVAPSFTDSTVAQAQGGVFLDDRVLATGDGTITYSVPLGAMPSWLSLDTTNGLISGTPPLVAIGDPYSFTVTATGHGTATATISGVVAAAPSTELTLDFAVGDLAAGSPFGFDIAGAGDAVPYSVTVNSTPVVVASGTTSALGAASGTAVIPSIGAGAHSIVLLTYASDGTARTVTVWFTVLRNGTIGAISLLGPLAYSEAALAGTGVDPALPVGAAALLLFLGVVALRVRKRLQQA
jgi:hypothetical protein